MTQPDFANRIGVSQSYLSAVERGRNEVGAEVLLVPCSDSPKRLAFIF
jgi:transcriptional regulator with XRE-family HTH domain